MPRKSEPSFELKKIVWDVAATVGKDKYEAISKQVDYELRKRQKVPILEEIPDKRKIKRIIEEDINDLSPEVVLAKLPKRLWALRSDYEAIKQLAEMKSQELQTAQTLYVETLHMQKMREEARNMINPFSLPFITASFIPGESYKSIQELLKIRDDRQVRIECLGLSEALSGHLQTGGFPDTLKNISDLRIGWAGNLINCYQFLIWMKEKIEGIYQVSIQLQNQGQPGLTIYFPMFICADVIEQAGGSTHFKDFPYKYQSFSLSFGAYPIYYGNPDEDLKPYERAHIKFRKDYAKHEQAKVIAEQRKTLHDNGVKINQQLQRFIDMEHVPGKCELCSQ